MNYLAFEVKQGDVLNRVEAMCRHLTDGGKFTETTPVSVADAEMFITDAYYWLLGELAKNGYNIAVTDTEAKAVLQQIQALDAVTQIESAQPVTDSGEPNDRAKGLVARRDRLVKDYLQTDTLEQLGATRDRNKSTYLDLTGRSIARKNSVYDTSDIVPARFPRGFGQRPGNRPPGGAGSGALEDSNLQ